MSYTPRFPGLLSECSTTTFLCPNNYPSTQRVVPVHPNSMNGALSVVVVIALVFTRTMTNSKITPMIQFDAQTILLAIIGMIGLFATATVVTYSFKRNRTGNSRYQ